MNSFLVEITDADVYLNEKKILSAITWTMEEDQNWAVVGSGNTVSKRPSTKATSKVSPATTKPDMPKVHVDAPQAPLMAMGTACAWSDAANNTLLHLHPRKLLLL